jgi:hypothetical protein
MTRSGATARQIVPLAGAALTLCLALAAGPPGVLETLSYLLPVLLLLLPLLGRTYPGEDLLLAVVDRRRTRPRRAPLAREPAARPRPRTVVPRGARLLAFSLAVRPPPTLLASPS